MKKGRIEMERTEQRENGTDERTDDACLRRQLSNIIGCTFNLMQIRRIQQPVTLILCIGRPLGCLGMRRLQRRTGEQVVPAILTGDSVRSSVAKSKNAFIIITVVLRGIIL